jgi:hypothetical protein
MVGPFEKPVQLEYAEKKKPPAMQKANNTTGFLYSMISS